MATVLDQAKEILKALVTDPARVDELSKALAAPATMPPSPGTAQHPAPHAARDPMYHSEIRKLAMEEWQPRFHKAGDGAGIPMAMKENPDQKADAELGENVEGLVERHFKENAAAESQEGHDLATKKSELAKDITNLVKKYASQKKTETDVQPPIDSMAKTGQPAPATAVLPPPPKTKKPAPKKDPIYHKEMEKADIHHIQGKLLATHEQVNPNHPFPGTGARPAPVADPVSSGEKSKINAYLRGKQRKTRYANPEDHPFEREEREMQARRRSKTPPTKKDEYAGQTAGPMQMSEAKKCMKSEQWKPRFQKSASAGPSPKALVSDKIIKPSDTKNVGAAGMAVTKPAGVKMAPVGAK